MTLSIVSVYDACALTYSKPYFESSTGSAVRSFQDACSNADSAISRHPEHYSLFLLGEYNTDNAKFDLLPTPKLLGNAWELVQK